MNSKDEEIKLDLFHPEKSGMVVKNVSGIGQIKSDININDYSTGDGGLYVGSRMPYRNIVLDLIFLDHPTIEETRYMCYRYFNVKRSVTLTFETDHRYCKITGYVESNEPDIFSSQEGSQISIICPDPKFYSASDITVGFSQVAPWFEFPFSNEHVRTKMIEFGIINPDNRAIITYKGDIDVGFKLTVHCNGPVTNLTLYNVRTQERIPIDTAKVKTITGSAIGDADEIIISTETGSKSAYLLRYGRYYNILAAIDRDADWFKISAGDNLFSFSATSGANNIDLYLTYHDAYGGV